MNMSFTKKTGCLWVSGGFILFLVVLFCLLIFYFEESWDQKGTGYITRVIDGETIELKDYNKIIQIKLAFVDAPSPQSVHGQKAINHIKKQINIFQKAFYRAKKNGDQYIGEVRMEPFGWDLSLNQQLIRNGLARVDTNEREKWKETTVNSYLKAQELTKDIKRGIWAYEGYVTKDGFNPKIEKEIAQQVNQAKQQQKRKKRDQQKQLQTYYQAIQHSLEAVERNQSKIAYIQFKDHPQKRGTHSYVLWVDVYVVEEKWANMTQSQKLSLIVTTEKEIRDRVNHLLTSGGTAIVQFFSDTAKDQVAEKKFLRLRGHDWRILR